ncbi:hypothetical protein [Actinoplanes aureus]|uniref:Uncharacterized protein n=1 Tax=Actinoplanes aureus TaxID=2792083 RepID=A0A931G2N2_9ACTN|nr:hypothetical protein [Actinoplanes aureus]MBG0569263.1 hypothetical protein [Actinoplanes aureus]
MNSSNSSTPSETAAPSTSIYHHKGDKLPLDEIDPALQQVAVAAIEEFAATDRGVVVTCRVREFQRATAGGVLARAAVVQLQPLAAEDVIAFLEDPDPRRRLLWQPVFAKLREDPGGVLGSALSTPLMAGLAKDVYGPRLGVATVVVPDPGELVQFTTRGRSRHG